MSYQYQYDAGGNLIQAIENDLKNATQKTNSYGYDSTYRDQLISYNGGSIRYDKGGNPTEYLGKQLSWTKGRQLANVSGTTYTYTSGGTRLSKKTNGKETTYLLDGDTILAEKTGDETLHYYYSQGGSVVSIGYQKGNAEEVYYTLLRNSSGDITDLYDAKTGARVGGYQYDAWGAVVSATKESVTSDPNNIVTKNPFRYQGYYYDQETGWYYLQSRYYDPVVKRFINADSTGILLKDCDSVLQYNLYAYCLNNPVNLNDPSGHDALTDLQNLQMKLLLMALAFLIAAALSEGGGLVLVPFTSGGSAAAGTAIAVDFAKAAGVCLAAALACEAAQTLIIAGQNMQSLIEAYSNKGGSGTNQQLKKLRENSDANKVANEYGYKNAEDFKGGFVGKKEVSKYNIKFNAKTKEIVLEALQGGKQVPTGLKMPKGLW